MRNELNRMVADVKDPQQRKVRRYPIHFSRRPNAQSVGLRG
jgi:hypothetical protein